MESNEIAVEFSKENEEVSFQELSSMSPSTISKLEKAFSEKGWVIVDYPEDFKNKLKDLYEVFQIFFENQWNTSRNMCN